MTTFGVTSEGFTPKRLADVVDSLSTNLNAIVDPVTGQALVVDMDSDTVVAQMANIVAEGIADAWSILDTLYRQYDPRYNTGAAQSGTVQINGILRRAATKTVLNVTLTGGAGTTIPVGSLLGTSDQKYQFALGGTVVLTGGSDAATVTCLTAGDVEVADSDALQIVTPVLGWSVAVCASTAVQGGDAETDEQLRVRQQSSTSATSYRQVEAIYAAVKNVPGVTFCRVYQNNTNSTDANGLPAKSIAVVALGGTDLDIAHAIFARVPVGIAYYGTTTVTLTDTQNIAYDVKFVRPGGIALDVAVTVRAVDTTFPAATYSDDIKNAIIAFATGGAAALGIPVGYDRNGWVPGESVYPSQIYTPINKLSGIGVDSLQICVHGGTPSSSPVTINWNEQATFNPAHITVSLAGG